MMMVGVGNASDNITSSEELLIVATESVQAGNKNSNSNSIITNKNTENQIILQQSPKQVQGQPSSGTNVPFAEQRSKAFQDDAMKRKSKHESLNDLKSSLTNNTKQIQQQQQQNSITAITPTAATTSILQHKVSSSDIITTLQQMKKEKPPVPKKPENLTPSTISTTTSAAVGVIAVMEFCCCCCCICFV